MNKNQALTKKKMKAARSQDLVVDQIQDQDLILGLDLDLNLAVAQGVEVILRKAVDLKATIRIVKKVMMTIKRIKNAKKRRVIVKIYIRI